MFGVGPLELVIVLLIVLVVFGAKRLPEMGRQLGSGMREFKEGIVNPVDDVKQEFTSPMAEETRSANRTQRALPRPAEAETSTAPKAQGTVSD